MTITVVIATYGDQHWADLARRRALPSVTSQHDGEVIVHHEPDLTIGPARNAATSQATGDWVIHLDADDELAPGYIDAMRHAATKRHNTMTLFQPAVSYIHKGKARPARILPHRDLRHDNFLVVGTMVARSLFNKVGGFEDYPHGFEDFSLWAKCWKAGAVVAPTPRAVYRAFVNPESKHRTMWRDRTRQVYWHMRVQHELFPEDYPNPPVPPAGMII